MSPGQARGPARRSAGVSSTLTRPAGGRTTARARVKLQRATNWRRTEWLLRHRSGAATRTRRKASAGVRALKIITLEGLLFLVRLRVRRYTPPSRPDKIGPDCSPTRRERRAEPSGARSVSMSWRANIIHSHSHCSSRATIKLARRDSHPPASSMSLNSAGTLLATMFASSVGFDH